MWEKETLPDGVQQNRAPAAPRRSAAAQIVACRFHGAQPIAQ